jgi:hypothetical protein
MSVRIELRRTLKLVVCILLRVLGQVQGFRLTQRIGLNIYSVTATCFGLMTIFRWTSVALDGNPEPD